MKMYSAEEVKIGDFRKEINDAMGGGPRTVERPHARKE
jgi:hypothetical protein